MAKKKTLQEDLEALGVPIANHETDLQVIDTPAVRRVLAKHGKRLDGHNVTQFENRVEGGTWLEIPFAYTPRTPAERVLGKRGGGAVQHREPVDDHAATELELYIENDYELVGKPNSIGKNIEAMLMRKVSRGKFEVLPSVKAWMYLIDAGAKKYAREFSTSERDWPKLFNKATREKVATRWARHWAQENANLQVQ